jgi:hypothetical protein
MAESSGPAFLGNYLAGLPRPEHMDHGPARSIREDEFNGHHIVITTTTEIAIDGRPLRIHVGLSNDGSAHCHGLPAYQFASMVDMVRVLIHYFPDDFPPVGVPSGEQDEPERQGGHQSGGM